MKANEAPERVYCESDGLGNIVKVHNVKWPDDEAENIEYTNTDAFFEKACEWLKENADMYEAFDSESKSYYMDKDKLVEDFKEYMKGEKV